MMECNMSMSYALTIAKQYFTAKGYDHAIRVM